MKSKLNKKDFNILKKYKLNIFENRQKVEDLESKV